MNSNSHTIFPIVHQDITEQSENKKISYWLKKLFDQQKQKVIDDKREKEEAASKSEKQPSVENKSPPYVRELEKSPEQKGVDENVQSRSRKIENDRQLIKEMVKKSNRSIISISSLFPWDLFPNTIRVEESRVTFLFRQFMTYQSHSVDINDISNVFIETSFLFATLQVVSRTYVQNDIKIGHLRKKDAIQVRKIIEGLRMFMQKNIDTSNYEIPDLLEKLEELHTNSTK